jgi:hypothetical protein
MFFGISFIAVLVGFQYTFSVQLFSLKPSPGI